MSREFGRRIAFLALMLVGLAVPPAVADEAEDDARATALVETYLAERREDSWGAFQRRLDALRALGALPCPAAREALLRVAATAKGQDDRLLAALGLARIGNVPSLDALLTLVAKRRDPVMIELVGEALASRKDGAAIAWLSAGGLRRPEAALPPVLRAHAYAGLPEAAEALAARVPAWLAAPAHFDLAFDALIAVGRSGGPTARALVLASAGHADPRVRLAVADVLALQSPLDDEVATVARTLLGDADPTVKRALAAGIAAAKAQVLLPDLTRLLEDDDPRTRKAALDALEKMTGQNFGFDGGAWRRWASKEAPAEARVPHTVVAYHGIEIFTERAVFILDCSGSMLWPHAPEVITRMDVARDELGKVLGKLSPATLFNVIAFNAKVDPWRKGEAKADPATVQKAVTWVRKQEAEKGSGTNTYGVLERAFTENPGFDTIYFLSDGIPEDGDVTVQEGLLAAVRHWNRHRRVRIHTVALTLGGLNPGRYPITGSMREAAAFMRDLARVGGGDYRLIERPPGP